MINTCHCERSEAIQPIYIDGVDVSKCKFYSEKLECCNGSGFIQVANGCGFCTHNIRGLDDADVYVQTFARCLNNECYYKELKARVG